MEMWAGINLSSEAINLSSEEMRAESEVFAALSGMPNEPGSVDSLARQSGIDYQQAAFLESLLRHIGLMTGAALMGHGQRMKSVNDFSAHLKCDDLGGYWLDISAAFKGDHEGAVLAAREWAEDVGALEGIANIDYVRLRGTDGTDELAFGEESRP
jgi:hypothetical protein